MKIIDAHRNVALAEASTHVGAGFIVGPVRMIAAIAQIALNGIAAIFTAVPSSLGYLEGSSFHATYLLSDAGMGVLHLIRGLLELLLPGSSFFLNATVNGQAFILISDHPFNGIIDYY